MANREHMAILKKGVEEWNAWRREKPSLVPDLSGVSFARANLCGVNFHEANLHWAYFREADLRGANLSRANLEGLISVKLLLVRRIYATLNSATPP